MRYSALSMALAGPLAVRAASGTGQTTRYWDCCKPSCAWEGKASVDSPVLTCDKNDNPISDANAVSGCDGGTAFTCSNYSPWAVNDNLAYGFAATKISGGSESSWCCACYALTFTSGAVKGKTMVVQSTNTGSDLGDNHFDLLMPGGGVGIFDGCTKEFGTALPGAQYGGISSQSQCSSFPEILKDGCNWRFNWFDNSDNPSVTFEQVQCPTELTKISGCKRDDDSSFPAFTASGSSSGSSSSSSSVSAAAAASSQVSSQATSVAAQKTETAEAQTSSSTSVAAVSQHSETAVATESETAAQSQTQAADATETTETPVQTESPSSQGVQTRTRTRSKASGCSVRKSTATPGSASTPVSAASASTSTVAVYQQCNGSKDLFPNGALPCASGSKCVYSNDWYSQCVPN